LFQSIQAIERPDTHLVGQARENRSHEMQNTGLASKLGKKHRWENAFSGALAIRLQLSASTWARRARRDKNGMRQSYGAARRNKAQQGYLWRQERMARKRGHASGLAADNAAGVVWNLVWSRLNIKRAFGVRDAAGGVIS
jgi:hypothetical protein